MVHYQPFWSKIVLITSEINNNYTHSDIVLKFLSLLVQENPNILPQASET